MKEVSTQQEGVMPLLWKISSEVFEFEIVNSLNIYDKYLQIPPQGKDISDFYKSFIREEPSDALLKLSSEGKEKFDLILNSYSRLGMRRTGWIHRDLNIDIKARENWVMIFQSLTLLSENGSSLAIIEPMFWISKEGEKFRKELNDKAFFVNAIFQTPPGILEMTSIRPYIILFSRKETKEIFVVDLDEGFNLKQIASNYQNNESTNIYEGLFVSPEQFKGFERYKAEKEFEILAKQYKKYEKVVVKNIVKEHSTKDFTDDSNSIYLRMAGNFKVVDFEDITKNRYLQLKLDIDKVNPLYLRTFLNSDIGVKYLDSFGNGAVIKHLQVDEFLNSEIYLLPLELQNKTIDIMTKIDNLKQKIDNFEQNVLHDPDSSSQVTLELNMLTETLENLSEEEALLSSIRGGETQHVEFKQTLSKNIKTKQKDKTMERMVLKTLCGFMNTDGGTLFVGVKDTGEICGIDKEMFAKNNDKFLLHFKNLLKDQIGVEYFPLINYEIKNLLDKDVLVINCKRSEEPVFLGKESFYIRSNPATDELKGQEQHEYIKNHFKK